MFDILDGFLLYEFWRTGVRTLAVPHDRESPFHRNVRSKAWPWPKALVHMDTRTLNLGDCISSKSMTSDLVEDILLFIDHSWRCKLKVNMITHTNEKPSTTNWYLRQWESKEWAKIELECLLLIFILLQFKISNYFNPRPTKPFLFCFVLFVFFFLFCFFCFFITQFTKGVVTNPPVNLKMKPSRYK